MTKNGPLQLLRRYWLELLTLVSYGVGVAWRYKYIFDWHDPRKFIYSDMKMYFDLGIRLSKPDYVPKPADVTHPGGLSELMGYFVRQDAIRLGIFEDRGFAQKFTKATQAGETLEQLVQLQFVLTCLIPPALLFLGWAIFGRRTGLWAAAIGSLYYPFIEFGGYFLAEVYMMVLVPVVVGLYFLALRVASGGDGAQGRDGSNRGGGGVLGRFGTTGKRLALGCAVGALAGVTFAAALSMKTVALPGIVGFLIIHFLFTRGPTRWIRGAVVAAMMFAAAPGVTVLTQRCTAANDGNFCLGSNKSRADFLLAHYGRIQGVSWKPKAGAHFTFGSPSAYQHGYRDVPEVPFGMFDSEANSKEAWKWIRKNPGPAIGLSLEHVADTFFGALPWPAYATQFWLGAQVALYLFIVFIMFPAGVLLLDILRQRGVLGLLRSVEFAVISPLIGVAIAVAIATGEIRYRVPWDGMLIVVGIEFYRRLKVSFFEPAAATATATVPAQAVTEPVAEPVAEPVVEPVVEPVAEPVAERAAQLAPEPSAAPDDGDEASSAPEKS